jgi:hypothetical protein
MLGQATRWLAVIRGSWKHRDCSPHDRLAWHAQCTHIEGGSRPHVREQCLRYCVYLAANWQASRSWNLLRSLDGFR